MASDAGYTIGDFAPLGRDRRSLHRRLRRRHRRGADQDRIAEPHRSDREVQPAFEDRRGARIVGALRRTEGVPAMTHGSEALVLTILDGWGYSPGGRGERDRGGAQTELRSPAARVSQYVGSNLRTLGRLARRPDGQQRGGAPEHRRGPRDLYGCDAHRSDDLLRRIFSRSQSCWPRCIRCAVAAACT